MKFIATHLIVTPGAQTAIRASGQSLKEYLSRHYEGDWGEQNAEDRLMYDNALRRGHYVMSAFRLITGCMLWIETVADRSATAVYLSEER